MASVARKLAFLATGTAVGLGALFASSLSTADAQSGRCEGAVNGSLTTEHAGWKNALRIDASRPVELALRVDGPVGVVQVTVSSGPVSRTIRPIGDRQPAEGTSWSGQADVEDVAQLSVGLTKVRVFTSEGCDLSFWVDVQGNNPATTVAGGTSVVAMAAGVAMQILGIVRGAVRRKGFLWAIAGGIAAGLGACVLAQQAGVTPITWQWALTWTSPPVLVGGLLQAGVSTLSGRRRVADLSRAARDEDDWRGDVSTDESSTGRSTGAAGTNGTGHPSATNPSGSPIPTSGTTSPPRPGPGGRDPASQDPPRTAFGLLHAPGVVVVETSFEVEIGLAPEQQAGVTGGPLVRPESSVGSYVLTVQLVADGFELAEGETWRHELPVTARAPYPSVVVHLRALPQSAQIHPRVIQALFSTDGQTMGVAIRPIAIVLSPDTVAPYRADEPVGSAEMSVPTNPKAADLTVRIQQGDSISGGRLLWTFDTPHPVPIPDNPIVSDIGSEPGQFLKLLIEGVGSRDGKPGLYSYLAGLGVTIADEMPPEFWDILHAVARARPPGSGPPTLFILSEEPYVPWELALIDSPLSEDTTASPFLGAQACVGRWVLGQRRPKLPPPMAVQVEGVVVIAGIYDREGWVRLEEAEGEAAELAQVYGGSIVEARPADILRCLGGDPPAEVLHFAVHGVYDPTSVINGLVLVDGSTLDPFQVKGQVLRSAPFVFLNACQVGSGHKVLGDYAGMAEAFLYAGASGVVAPLWSISDTVARSVSRRFYEHAFEGQPLGDVMRQERASFRQSEGAVSSTGLAYVFYGHPSLRLKQVRT